MSNTKTISSSSTSSKGFSPSCNKTISRSKWLTDVNTFVSLFDALQRQSGIPRLALRTYNMQLRTRLLCNGHGYLVNTRSYPIYGLRYLGGDVIGNRSPDTFFVNERLRPNADGVLVPKFLSWYWNRLWTLSKCKTPTKGQALEVSRILAILSFSKFLLLETKKSRRLAFDNYVKRVKSPNGKVPIEFKMYDNDPNYQSMLEFLRLLNCNRAGQRIAYDRQCYSLKSLTGKKTIQAFCSSSLLST
jgi:hypothetical protein